MAAFSLVDLALGATVGFAFILMFWVHRVRYPDYYFSLTEIIYGFRSTIRPVVFIIRMLMIFGFALISFLLLGRPFPVYFGVALGSFLTVWPGILAPDAHAPQLYHRRAALLVAYALFIASSLLLASLAALAQPTVVAYLSTYADPMRRVTVIGDKLVIGALSAVLLAGFYKLLGYLNREIALPQEVDYDALEEVPESDRPDEDGSLR